MRSPARILIILTVLIAAFAPNPLRGAMPEVTLIAGGDIEWSRIIKTPGIYFNQKKPPWWEKIFIRAAQKLKIMPDDWKPLPYVLSSQSKTYLENRLGQPLENSESHHIAAIPIDLKFSSTEDMVRYPFQKIGPIIRAADIAFANLETPLSDRGRTSGAFRTPVAFAQGLKWAGFDVLSTANNHALDAEGVGLTDTREALENIKIGAVGTGENLSQARKPFIIEKNEIRLAFFGYAQWVNVGPSGFALANYSGVVPLDPFLIKEDIQRIRSQVDYVVLSFHWGVENKQGTHPDARKFAHSIIDSGADIILGHHPHLPGGIEIYKGKLIVYSLGNLIFGHNHANWTDNYLARITLSPDKITKVEVIPVAGKGQNLAQPHPLTGESADALLKDVQELTATLDTKMKLEGDSGIIIP